MHRQKADEAYEIGQRGQYTPVGAYLAGDEIIKIAVEHVHGALRAGERLRRGRADARSAAGDDDHFVSQGEHEPRR